MAARMVRVQRDAAVGQNPIHQEHGEHKQRDCRDLNITVLIEVAMVWCEPRML